MHRMVETEVGGGGKDILVPGTPSLEGFLRGCVRNEKTKTRGSQKLKR